MADIGLLNEKPLHASLKDWCSQPGDRVEVSIDGYVIDIVRHDMLLEIQTGSFASIKSKLLNLAKVHRIRLIYPIAREKWILKPSKDKEGEFTRRKSPKRGRVEDLFREMVSFPQLILVPGFSIEVLMIREEEVRRYEENRHWRRRGWITDERRLVEVLDQHLFEKPSDWQALLPENPGETFTTGDLAGALGIRRQLAQKMAYCLRKVNIIELVCKQGRSNHYRIAHL